MIRSPALSQITASRGFVHSGAEYSGWAWSTYRLAPLVRMTLASPTSSSVSWLASASSLARSKPRASRSGFSSSKSQRARRVRAVAAAYALTTWEEVSMALAAGWPGTEMPYSVSVPMTRHTLMGRAYVGRCAVSAHNQGTTRTRVGHGRSAPMGPDNARVSTRLRCANPGGNGAERGYRYWPVLATVSMERPASVPSLPEPSW